MDSVNIILNRTIKSMNNRLNKVNKEIKILEAKLDPEKIDKEAMFLDVLKRKTKGVL